MIALYDLLKQQRIKPLIVQRFPLAEARHAHELLGKGDVIGKIVLVCNGASLESGGSVTAACTRDASAWELFCLDIGDRNRMKDLIVHQINIAHYRLIELTKLADQAKPFYDWVESHAKRVTGSHKNLNEILLGKGFPL